MPLRLQDTKSAVDSCPLARRPFGIQGDFRIHVFLRVGSGIHEFESHGFVNAGALVCNNCRMDIAALRPVLNKHGFQFYCGSTLCGSFCLTALWLFILHQGLKA